MEDEQIEFMPALLNYKGDIKIVQNDSFIKLNNVWNIEIQPVMDRKN